MTTYRCRFVAPRRSDWSTVEADSPELAANEFHGWDERTYSIAHATDPDKPGARVHFARIEVEGYGELVSRIYTSGINRCGAARARVTLVEVAKAVGWKGDPAELLASGWEGEESGGRTP